MQQTILVVEDELDVVDLLRYNLIKEGFDVLTAHTGIQGFEMACEYRPDAMLLDLMLPGMNGIEVCQKLRQSADHKDMAILMITAKGEPS